MPKKTTLRFYTPSDHYTGWQYLTETTYFYIINWTESDNYILIKDHLTDKDQRIDKDTPVSNIFALLRRKQ